MRAGKTKIVAEQKPLGVIDALSAGFDVVRRRPWTILVPVLFDLALWVTPRLSLGPLLRPALEITALPPNASADTAQLLDESRALLQQKVDSINLLGLVTGALNGIGNLPSLFGVESDLPPSPVSGWGSSLPVQSGVLVLTLFVPLFLLGLFAVAIFLEGVAQGVRPIEIDTPTARWRRIAVLWIRLILYTLAAVALGLILLPILSLVLSSTLYSPEVGAFLTALVLVIFFWVYIYLFFVVDAMAVTGVGLREALRRSMLLFRVNFWQSATLVILTLLIRRGLWLLWVGLQVSPLGVAAGIAANAFIGTALIAASMIFYQDRFNWIARMRERIQRKRA